MLPAVLTLSPSRSQFRLAPGLWLDARRAIWLETERVLAVADLHLGYIWAQRAQGNLLPLCAPEDAIHRLAELVREYGPREVIVLGNVVHRAVSVEPIREELRRLCRELGDVELQLLAGNHDRALAALLHECKIALPLAAEARVGAHRFLHGDRPPAAPETEGLTFIGHEHPAISLGDGHARVKCPCFLVRRDLVVLPAFSNWAAGSEVRGSKFLSPLARAGKFTRAVAILAGKLLPVPL